MGRYFTARVAGCFGLVVLSIPAVADPLPNPVRTCTDINAYIDSDKSMTMDRFKSLLTAAGFNLEAGGNAGLDNQCKLTAVVKHVVMVQRILKKEDGTEVRVTTQVVQDNGACKLTDIALSGC
jgi:hypothetical protein